MKSMFHRISIRSKRKQKKENLRGARRCSIRADLKHSWARTSWRREKERYVTGRPWQRHGGASGDVSGVLNEIRFARVYLRPTHFLPPCRERNATSYVPDVWLLVTFYVSKTKTSDPWTKKKTTDTKTTPSLSFHHSCTTIRAVLACHFWKDFVLIQTVLHDRFVQWIYWRILWTFCYMKN